MSQLLKPAVVFALYALLLPVVGPALDHHYVEWQHNHGHVYFGGEPGERGLHLHIYDHGGDHGHVPVTDLSNGWSVPEDVAYFSGFDGLGNGPISASTGPFAESLIFPDPGDRPLLASYVAKAMPPEGALVAPPRKPPTA